MDLTLNQEEQAIRDAIRGALDARLPMAKIRAMIDRGASVDDGLWAEAASLGWFGLATPEAHGGAGYGLPEAMLLFIELGQTLAPGPWLGTVVAAATLPAGADLTRVLDGSRRVALIDDPEDALGGGTSLRGKVKRVAGLEAATACLVVGARAVRWIGDRDGSVTVDTAASVDPTRPLSDVAFGGTVATALDVPAARVRDTATLLAAAEAVGVAERTLLLSVEFAKVRVQFGKPIGTFQAIKHRCADMAVRAEVARSATTWAAVALRDGADDASFHVHTAKALATDAALQNATDAIQNHGGMGYTWEADPHLYLKRARLLEHTCGSRVAHLDAIAAPWRATT